MLRLLLPYRIEVCGVLHKELKPITSSTGNYLFMRSDYLTTNDFLNNVLNIPAIVNFISLKRQQFLKTSQHYLGKGIC